MLADGRDGVIIIMSAKALRIDLIPVGLAELLIVTLMGEVILPFINAILEFGANILTGVCIILARFAVEVIPVSYHAAVRVGWIIDASESDISVDVLAGVNASIWSVVMTTLALRFAWEACSCWATADWNCRVSQARMPSCHV